MAEPTSLVADRVYGGIALALVALAAFFALRGGPVDGAAPQAPALRVLAPAPGIEVDQPVTLHFDAGTPLRQAPAGWGEGDRHVHVRVGTLELMPGPGDIEPLSGTRYRWVLPRLPAGDQTLQLFWSDEAHRPLRGGASAPVRVMLR